jgi:hypothetical protein
MTVLLAIPLIIITLALGIIGGLWNLTFAFFRLPFVLLGWAPNEEERLIAKQRAGTITHYEVERLDKIQRGW